MTRTLTITYDKSNEDVPVLCVAESNFLSVTVLKMFIGEKAENLYRELTGQNVVVRNEFVEFMNDGKKDEPDKQTKLCGELYPGEFESK